MNSPTAHRVVEGLPLPVPSTSQGAAQASEHYYQTMGPRVSTSQSTMALSSLIPSASIEPISEWIADGNRMTVHNRSVSEPDFGRTPGLRTKVESDDHVLLHCLQDNLENGASGAIYSSMEDEFSDPLSFVDHIVRRFGFKTDLHLEFL
ncbi:hypothetical protein ACSBR1_042027 [Camellia fascicularis]